MSDNPLQVKPEIELADTSGVCTECKTKGTLQEFVIFIGMTPIYTGAKYCEECIKQFER